MAKPLWQYEDGPDVWRNYSDKHITALNAAIAANSNTCDLKLPNNYEISVDFDKGIQTRKGGTTGPSRKVRVVFVLQSGNSATREVAALWQADLKPWSNMPPSAAHKLEAAHSRGDASVSVSIGGNSYTVDLRKLHQTNDRTGFRRNIRRRVLAEREFKSATAAAKSTGAAAPPAPSAPTRRTSGRLAAGARKRPAASPSPPPSDDDVGDDEEAQKRQQKQKRQKQKNGSSGRAAASAAAEEDEDGSDEKVVLVRGGAAVDSELTGLSAASVRVHAEGGTVYDAMLNQTNLQFNNNKFYLLQLLHKAPRDYWVWFRWGRVGKTGQHSLVPCGPDLDRAKALFCKKFEDKTKNEWASVAAKTFTKVAGKYDLVHRDHKAGGDGGAGDDKADKAAKKQAAAERKAEAASRLHAALQALLGMICDVQQMEDTVVEMRYDAKRMPLGKLTAAQIKAGFVALKAIEALVRGGHSSGQKLVSACNDFYTRIPHDFGMRVPPVIRSLEEIQAKADLLQALEQIQTALKVVSDGAEESGDSAAAEHAGPVCYRRLACDIEPVDSNSEEFSMIDRYLQTTHGPTHSLYTLSLGALFKVQRAPETARFRSDLPNRMLLWHGSRLSNWAGILSQGLRVAPPEAPATGYMFGKGVYFADVSSKSANYLYATRSKPTGVLALCEVALGTSRELNKADYEAAKLPAGFNSVKGIGELTPNPSSAEQLADGCKVPIGKLVASNLSTVLNYNEYVVYNVNQLRLRYLVQ
uniref:Poly [ADP-ribose] polymerase n=1 Tax=Macrostomum lignano TaxID=282301 RepID=A0A1I8HD94_9PLAT